MAYKVTKSRRGVPYFRPYGGGEAYFIITPGEIPTKLTRRNYGVFVRTGLKTYFTCPYCKGMNVTRVPPDSRVQDSVMCKRCDRHLFCVYRTVAPKYYYR